MNKKELELLSPAKDLECGIAAINCGADAVYIGAPKFGARAEAGNSIEDIQKLVEHAHKFWAKIYVTVNTLIYNNELDEAQKLITRLYDIGADAIIFQDMALLEMELPPIQLIASTQTHNYELERIKLLDGLGIKRIILARELSIEQIKEIRANTKAELEFFVHGALCVCLSGQCYLSEAMFGRSANRGECAQPCRLKYSLLDKNGKVIVRDKHLLSLKDLNLSAYLNELIEAGITSFKIEGRLKDIGYVKNTTAYYSQKLDSIIENNHTLKRSSSGHSIIPFEPDPDKTFNRGYTSYFIKGKDNLLSSIDTPKSIGKYLGAVIAVGKNNFTVGTKESIVNGDGLCFFNSDGELSGMNVSKVENNTIYTKNLNDIKQGLKIFRNHDMVFESELKKECRRKIKMETIVDETSTGLRVTATDEDGILSSLDFDFKKEHAINNFKATDSIKKQLLKSGGTIFEIAGVKLNFIEPIFLPVNRINYMRRKILETLDNERIQTFSKNKSNFGLSAAHLNKKQLDYKYNVTNKLSKQFYNNLGALEIEDGFELLDNSENKALMSCKYCIKDELGLCPQISDKVIDEPLYLSYQKKKYRLVFNCKDCRMELIYP